MRKISRADFLALGGWSLAGIFICPLTSLRKHQHMKDCKKFHVLIIGGSYAGLSAAMTLGRSLRHVLVIDSGKPCNRYAPRAHNFVTHDGEAPASIALQAKKQVLRYSSVQFFEGTAVTAQKVKAGFEIGLASGETFAAAQVILATGIRDIFPALDGFTECWGKTIIHCPYCHGYEFKDETTTIMANGDQAFHLSRLINNLTKRLTIITDGKATFNRLQKEKLDRNNVAVIEKPVKRIAHQDGQLKAVVFQDGSRKQCAAMYAALPFEQHSAIASSLGCEFSASGHIKTGIFQKTTVAGVFACGDNCAMMRSVAHAVASGNFAGAMANNELSEEQF